MTDVEQYKAILDGDPTPIVDDLVNHQKTEPVTEKWTGVVVNNQDPERLGRCQIRVIGFYDDIQDDMLPWAIPDISFMGGKCGSQIIPENETMVRGYFEKGDVQRPVFDALAFNAYNSESQYTKVDRRNWFDYPHTMVLFETDQGDFLTLNRKDGTLNFTHRSGAMFNIDMLGNITFQNGPVNKTGLPAMLNVTCQGNMSITCNGNSTVYTRGYTSINGKGKIYIGKNLLKENVNNLKTCFICGALHSTQTQVKV